MTPPLHPLRLTRLSGAGNTFFVVNALGENSKLLPKASRAAFVRRVCQDAVGLQTDGMVFLDPALSLPQLDFTWDFYNSDGSSAEMCGNAARCAAYYYYQFCKTKPTIQFSTIAGAVRAQVIVAQAGAEQEPWVEVLMPAVAKPEGLLSVKRGHEPVRGFFINTGVPHFVLESEPDFALAQELRHAAEFGKAGSNITFVEVGSDASEAITYERGVENFTLACGTGAVAAAEYVRSLTPEKEEVWIAMPGGALQVRWEQEGQLLRPVLSGPVELQFEMQVYEEYL